MNLLCTEKQKMNSNTVLLFAFLLNVFFTHTLFICVALERYSTKNILPLHTIYIANRFSFCNKHTNSIVTILIVDLLTLGIIRTVDIFTDFTLWDSLLSAKKDKLEGLMTVFCNVSLCDATPIYIVGAMNSFLFTADRFATLTIITTLKSSSVLMVLNMVETSESSKTCVVLVESACLFNISLL